MAIFHMMSGVCSFYPYTGAGIGHEAPERQQHEFGRQVIRSNRQASVPIVTWMPPEIVWSVPSVLNEAAPLPVSDKLSFGRGVQHDHIADTQYEGVKKLLGLGSCDVSEAMSLQQIAYIAVDVRYRLTVLLTVR